MSTGWNRLAAGTGLVSMVLLVVGIASGPAKIISTNSSVDQIAANIGKQTHLQLASNTLMIVGVTFFLAFAAVLADRIRTSDGAGPLAAWLTATSAVIVVFTTLDVIVLTAMDFLVHQGGLTAEPQLTRFLYHLYNGILMPGVAHLGFAAFFAIVAAAARRGALRPRWISWPCFVLAPLAVVNSVIALSTSNGGAFVLAPLAVFGFIVVNVALSISMLRDRGASDQPTPAITVGPALAPHPVH